MKKILQNKLLVTIIVFIIYFTFIVFNIINTNLTLGNFFAHLLLLLILVFIYFDDLKKDWKEYKGKKKNVLTILLFFVIFYVLGTIFSNIIIDFYNSITGGSTLLDSSQNTIYSLFDKVPLGTLFVFFFTIVYVPIVEELVFRKSLGNIINNKVLFVIMSSLLSWYFSVTILNPTINEFILANGIFLSSIFASIVYVKKKNILYTIFPRMLLNLFVCIVQLIVLLTK